VWRHLIASCMCLVQAVPTDVDDRYEPLPGILQLPGYAWRRLSRGARVGVACAAVAAVALIVLLAPSIERSREEHARAEAERSARIRAQDAAQTRREQRPRFDRAAPAGRDLAARGGLVATAIASIRADAAGRAAAGEFNGPIDRVECEGYPAAVAESPADTHPTLRTGRYACIAVTSDIPATAGNRAGLVGHPYRMRIDFSTGRYAFCKVRGRPGELAVKAPTGVGLSPACGG
jgi:hypothetical protein